MYGRTSITYENSDHYRLWVGLVDQKDFAEKPTLRFNLLPRRIKMNYFKMSDLLTGVTQGMEN